MGVAETKWRSIGFSLWRPTLAWLLVLASLSLDVWSQDKADSPLPISGLVSGARAVSSSEGNAIAGSPGGTVAATPDVFSGALTSAIPFRLPPGTKSPISGLALTYNSRRGNGPVGVGWSFELPYITVAPERTASASSVQFVFHNGGESIDLVRKTDAEYQARVERNFMRFSRKTGADGSIFWEAITRQGVVLTLGKAAITRVQQAGDAEASAWLLDEALEPSGNRISVTYEKAAAQSLPLPTRLVFDSSKRADIVGRSLTMVYEDRPDSVAVAIPGIAADLTKRLSQIIVYVGTAAYDSMKLTYEDRAFSKSNAAASLLKDVLLTTSVSGAKPLRLATFSYGRTDSAMESAELGAQPFAFGVLAEQCLFGNFSGQGRTDMVCHHQGNWQLVQVGPTGMSASTLAGAPTLDPALALKTQCLVGEFEGKGQANIACYVKTKAAWVVMRLVDGQTLSAAEWTGPEWTGQCLVLDANRDGRADLVCQSGDPAAEGQWVVSLSTGRSWSTSTWASGPVGGFRPPTINFPGFPPAIFPLQPFAQGYCLTGDFNGDRRGDVACYRNDLRKWQVGISTGGGWTTTLQDGPIPENEREVTKKCVAFDFDGNGRSDIACASAADSWTVALSKPNQIQLVNWNGGPTSSFAENCLAADLNGDGKIDFACNDKKAAVWSLVMNTGSGWQREDLPWVDLSNREARNVCFSRESGFQKTELLCSRTDGVYERMRSSGSFTHLLRGIVSSIGAKSTIDYRSSADTSSPRMPAMPVVSRVETDIGTGVTAATTFTYVGGLFDYLDRSFRGFSKVIAQTTAHAQVETTTTEHTFYQGALTADGSDDPNAAIPYLRGRAKSRQVLASDGSPVTRQEFIYQKAASAPYFSPLIRVLSYACISNCKLTQTDEFEVDPEGNISVEVRTYSGITAPAGRRIERTFQDSADGRLRGYPSMEQVFSTDKTKLLSQTRFSYDAQNNCQGGAGVAKPAIGLVTRISRLADNGAEAETDFSYDDAGNITCVRDPLGQTTRFAVDTSLGLIRTATNAIGHVTTYSYYEQASDEVALFGQIKSVRGADGIVVRSEYDYLRRLAKVYVNAKSVPIRELRYSDLGDPKTQNIVEIDGVGLKKTMRFDGGGNPVLTINDLTASTAIQRRETWIPGSLRLSQSLPGFVGLPSTSATTFRYDALGRVKRIEHPSKRISSVCYAGPIEIMTDGSVARRAVLRSSGGDVLKYVSLASIPASDCSAIASLITPDLDFAPAVDAGSQRSVLRDELGRIVSVIDGGVTVRSATYDLLGRLKEDYDVNRGKTRYVYDLAGNTKEQTDNTGKKIVTDYDSINRPRRVEISQNAKTQTITLNYDDSGPRSIGKLTRIVSGSISESIRYDDDGRPAEFKHDSQGQALEVVKTFDGIGRIASIKYPDGVLATYVYDGRLLKQIDVNGKQYVRFENPTPTGAYQRAIYSNGIVRELTFSDPSNVACPLPGFLLCTDSLKSKDGTTISKRRLVFDTRAKLIQVDDMQSTLGTVSNRFYYDNFGRLTAHATKLSSTDWIDKAPPAIPLESLPPGTVPVEYKSLDPDANWGSIYAYDKSGNVTWSARNGRYSYPQPGNPQPDAVREVLGLQFTYDDSGRAKSAMSAITLDYDLSGRISSVAAGGSKTSFLFGGSGELVQYQANGKPVLHVVGKYSECYSSKKCRNSIQVGTETVGYVEEGAPIFTHRDHLGSVRTVTDKAGAIGARYIYGTFGETTTEIGGPLKRYRSYAGGQAVDGIDVYRMGPRIYYPRIGRFLSPDPIANWETFRQDSNPYSYAYNNPTYFVDPEGDFAWAIVAVAALIGGYQASQHGDNILEGALRGAVFGVFIAGGYAVIGAAGVTSSFGQGYIMAYSGAWGGIAQTAIWGGDPGQAAQAGAISALGGHLLGGMEVGVFGNSNGLAGTANYVATAAVKGAALSAMYAAATGRDIRESALEGAQSGATGALAASALHHGVGLAFSGKAPTWDPSRKVFVYRMTQAGWHGISIGNVVSSNQFGPTMGPPTRWNQHVMDHEANHTWKQSTALGPGYGYIGSHAVAELLSLAFTGGGSTHEANILEADFGYIDVPYDKMSD